MGSAALTPNSPSTILKSIMYDEPPIEDLQVDSEGMARIALAAPATSGYRWEVSSQPEGVRIERRGVEPGEGFGAAAVQSFSIELKGDEPRLVVLALTRLWEEKPVEVRRFRVTPCG